MPEKGPSPRSQRLALRLNEKHGYLRGNYAPVRKETPTTRCSVVQGALPPELAGGQYVRNGGNPMANDDDQRDSHWFDGDGMLAGVLFQRDAGGNLAAFFTGRYVVTDVLLATPKWASRPILPSIATLSSMSTPLWFLLYDIFRSVVLCFLTWIPFTAARASGSGTRRLSKISVANTSVYYHDGKVLAGCESGPPMRIMLPNLDTAGWWTGDEGKSWAKGIGPLKLFQEMTTAHPHTDTSSNELLLYHSSFVAPYLRVSVIPPRSSRRPALIGATVPGMKEGKLMHDFAATRTRTVVLDLPLSLDPRNMLHGRPIVHYEPKAGTRFGIFPRREPSRVLWYEDPTACCIYHTANCWDEEQAELSTGSRADQTDAVNFLACRLNSATLVYSAGNLVPPDTARAPFGEPERCELYYWRFQSPPSAPDDDGHPGSLAPTKTGPSQATITHAFPLSRVPFEFPAINLRHQPAAGLGPNRFIYGCSMRQGTFDAGMGRNSAKIDCLVKMDAQHLVAKGRRLADSGKLLKGQAVDERSMLEILEGQENAAGKDDNHGASEDPIKAFPLPAGWFAQEPTFIPRSPLRGNEPQAEDDGYLVFYAFDESTHLCPKSGEALPTAYSELWIVDARDMATVVARVALPARVPYGLHGKWFSREEMAAQESVEQEHIRRWALREEAKGGDDLVSHERPLERGVMSTLRRLPAALRRNLEALLA